MRTNDISAPVIYQMQSGLWPEECARFPTDLVSYHRDHPDAERLDCNGDDARAQIIFKVGYYKDADQGNV